MSKPDPMAVAPRFYGGMNNLARMGEVKEVHLARFWAKVERRGPDECWPWTGHRDKKSGHGVLSKGRVLIKAHRFSYWLEHGVIPSGPVLHKCDNAWCVNPSHLEEGTPRKNQRDRVERGFLNPRSPPVITNPEHSLPGERNPNAKLRTADVIAIRRLGRTGMTGKQIAETLGLPVSASLVNDIIAGQAWRHVPEDLDAPCTLIPSSETP